MARRRYGIEKLVLVGFALVAIVILTFLNSNIPGSRSTYKSSVTVNLLPHTSKESGKRIEINDEVMIKNIAKTEHIEETTVSLIHKPDDRRTVRKPHNSNIKEIQIPNHAKISSTKHKKKNKPKPRMKIFPEKTESIFVVEKFIESYVKECESNPLNISYRFRKPTETLCPCMPNGLGKLQFTEKLDPQKEVPVITGKSDDAYDVSKKGMWSPRSCLARQRIAVIVPYRGRPTQLEIFLNHMQEFLKKQMLEYTIIIVEQALPTIFNRAALMNIGFVEAHKIAKFDCFIFHDVDLIAEDTRNIYTCTTSPRHVAVAMDKSRYNLQYFSYVGGALAMTRDQMLRINGFSNKFYGWGGEDDDIYHRIIAKKLKVTRYPLTIGRYTMLSHGRDPQNRPNPTGGLGLQMRIEEYKVDGLNSLRYNTTKIEHTEKCAIITVNIM